MQRNHSSLIPGQHLDEIYHQIDLLKNKRLEFENKLKDHHLLHDNIVDDQCKESVINEAKQVIFVIEKLIARRNHIVLTYKNIRQETHERILEIKKQCHDDEGTTKIWAFNSLVKLEEKYTIYLANVENYLLNMINASISYLFLLEKKENILSPLASGCAAINDNPKNFKIHLELKATLEDIIREVSKVKIEQIEILSKVLVRGSLKNNLGECNDLIKIDHYISCYHRQFPKHHFFSQLIHYHPVQNDKQINGRLAILRPLVFLYKKHEQRKNMPQYQHKFNVLAACLSYLFCIDDDKSIFKDKLQTIDALFLKDKEINTINQYKNVLIENNNKTKTCKLYEETKRLFEKDNHYEKGKLDLCLLIDGPPNVAERISMRTSL